jgi:hypothetical protein
LTEIIDRIERRNSKFEAPVCVKPLRRRQAKFETSTNVQNPNDPSKKFGISIEVKANGWKVNKYT